MSPLYQFSFWSWLSTLCSMTILLWTSHDVLFGQSAIHKTCKHGLYLFQQLSTSTVSDLCTLHHQSCLCVHIHIIARTVLLVLRRHLLKSIYQDIHDTSTFVLSLIDYWPHTVRLAVCFFFFSSLSSYTEFFWHHWCLVSHWFSVSFWTLNLE